MPNICIVCGKTRDKTVNRSLHRFPKNPERKKAWIASLCLRNEDLTINQHNFACSDHFEESDFFNSSLLNPQLQNSAVPTLHSTKVLSGWDIHSSSSEASDKEATEDFGIVTIRSNIDDPLASHGSDTISAAGCSSETLTASEIGSYHERRISDCDSDIQIIEYLPSRAAPTKRYHRYFGDFKREDIEDPKKRDQFWRLANEKYESQQSKIKSLQTQQRRMKNKMCSLRALVRQLKEKNLISEIAEITVNESISQSTKVVTRRRLKKPTPKVTKAQYSSELPEPSNFTVRLNLHYKKAYDYLKNSFDI